VLTVTYTGFVNGDGPPQLTTQPVITTIATPVSPIGKYPITVSGASAKNYAIVYMPGILEIVTGDISMPNTFTPNGDGINDTWDIRNLNLYTGCTVEVWNRYGQKVFYTNGYPIPWSGTLNGQQLPGGTYYYIIKLKPGAKTLSGSITLIR
ncbi:MAG TPA: gliding motility-associated C-terminal domain-containing protein, partial [Mucilaginibacter sp.]|nr:gliding motility-associated C-terminal domain-containing protein [Mucilaginibacter sp.]